MVVGPVTLCWGTHGLQLSVIMQSEQRALYTLLPQEKTCHITDMDGCILKHVVEEYASAGMDGGGTAARVIPSPHRGVQEPGMFCRAGQHQ